VRASKNCGLGASEVQMTLEDLQDSHKCCGRLRRCDKFCGRLCNPFSRCADCIEGLWASFERRCRIFGCLIRCLFCPFFLILRCLCCCFCCRCKSHDQDHHHDQSGGSPRSHRSGSHLGTLPRAGSTGSALGSSASPRAKAKTKGFRQSWSFSSSHSSDDEENYVLRSAGPTRSSLKRAKRTLHHHHHPQEIRGRQPRGGGAAASQGPVTVKPTSARSGREGRALRRGASMSAGAEGMKRSGTSTSITTGSSGLTVSETSSMQAEPIHWEKLLPSSWPPMYDRFVARRQVLWDGLETELEIMDKEYEYDFSKTDAAGMPVRRVATQPKWVLHAWWTFLYFYWDPLLDVLPAISTVLAYLKWSLAIFPFLLFLGSVGWLLLSLFKNLEYDPGDCQIEKLPDNYKLVDGLNAEVSGAYKIRRTVEPTPQRVGGVVIQQCDVVVKCEKLFLGRGEEGYPKNTLSRGHY
ncbi:unnamed protein product, partial [Polarella glacialis]